MDIKDKNLGRNEANKRKEARNNAPKKIEVKKIVQKIRSKNEQEKKHTSEA